MTKKEEKRKAQWKSVRVLIIVTVIFAAALSIPIVKARREKDELEKTRNAVLESLAEEQSWSEELHEMLEKEMSYEEIVDIARSKYGLVFPDEIIFMPED